MRRARKSYVLALVAAVVALLASTWATGVSLAQDDHDMDHDMDHDEPPPDDPPVDEPGGSAPEPNEQTTVVRYGPYDVQGASGEGHDGHAHTGSQIERNIEKPCENCYITAMRPDLVNEAGESVGVSTGPMLHHMVLFNTDEGRSDATCAAPIGLLGQRFFASGDERTAYQLPQGYGYEVGTNPWNFIWDLANHSTEAQTVYYQVTFDWVPASEADMTDIEPIWFDVDQCGDSNVEVPAGQSTVEWTWTANRSGEMISLGGHVHGNSVDGGGTNVTITNDTTGELLCDSVAGYGEAPLYVDHHETEWVSSVSLCANTEEFESLGTVNEGDQVTITGHYDQVEATDDQMGIAVGYLAESPPGGGDAGPSGNGGVAAPAPPIRGEPGFTG